MKKLICIHGHFYQPPRENPWLESVELQDSAYPYHDWNERVTAECYAPNSASRILNEKGKIIEITNNYSQISFNFGPTLLWWMKASEPQVYQAILQADQESRKTFSGHGSALAQIYNHIIMPLANHQDRSTQVIWGIKDFKSRFGRDPEGMWLSETAVDVETLEILASCGIRFTILEPHQAKRIRGHAQSSWKDLNPGEIDPTQSYEIVLPSGNSLACFFYDGPISRAVAFDQLLNQGEDLANRLLGAFPEDGAESRLVNIATDGETYGHHHQFGDMALAYALRMIVKNPEVELTNYGEYLEKFPPKKQVEILENTSWSCSHGIERWRSDCGCTTDGKPGWNQAWRQPLRESLDWLRDQLADSFESKVRNFFEDPWKARNDYIQVILDRSPENVERFFKDHASGTLQGSDKIILLKSMELQRNAMLMYTSCGWFFEELSRIETVQVLRYAARALQLAKESLAIDLEDEFLKRLEKAKSNIPRMGNGREIYLKFVKPAMVDLADVSAHYALSSLFEDYSEKERIFCYQVEREEHEGNESEKVKYQVGCAKFTSLITNESKRISYGAIHLGGHQMVGGIRFFEGEQSFQAMKNEIKEVFTRGDFAEVILKLATLFSKSTYTLRHLFRDEQRKVIGKILQSTLKEIARVHVQIYDQQAALIQFLSKTDAGVPNTLRQISEDAFNFRIRNAFQDPNVPYKEVKFFLQKAKENDFSLDKKGLGYVFQKSMEELMKDFCDDPKNETDLQKLRSGSSLLEEAALEVNLWKIQNLFFGMVKSVYSQFQQEAKCGNEKAASWVENFKFIGENLGVHVP